MGVRILGHTLPAAAILALVALAVAAGPAEARRGGQSATGGASTTLVASPNPAPMNSFFHAEGCGYRVGKQVNILVKHASTDFFGVGVDGNGCISFTSFTGEPGTYTLEAYQNLRGKQQTLMAWTTFEVR